GVAAAAFIGWVVSDYSNPRTDPQPRIVNPEAARLSVADSDIQSDRLKVPQGPSVVTSDQVPQLKPGMTRSEVEAIIGLPPADMVSPVTEVDGRMTYKAAYLANLDPGPAPIRGPVPVPRRLP